MAQFAASTSRQQRRVGVGRPIAQMAYGGRRWIIGMNVTGVFPAARPRSTLRQRGAVDLHLESRDENLSRRCGVLRVEAAVDAFSEALM